MRKIYYGTINDLARVIHSEIREQQICEKNDVMQVCMRMRGKQHEICLVKVGWDSDCECYNGYWLHKQAWLFNEKDTLKAIKNKLKEMAEQLSKDILDPSEPYLLS